MEGLGKVVSKMFGGGRNKSLDAARKAQSIEAERVKRDNAESSGRAASALNRPRARAGFLSNRTTGFAGLRSSLGG